MRATFLQLLVILGISVLLAGASALLHPKRPAWYRVASAEELRWQIDVPKAVEIAGQGPVLWVDARERGKYELEHLPDAVLLNLAEWGDLMFEQMDALQDAMGHSVIVYCESDECGKSHAVAQRLRELLGLEPVYVLKGNWRELSDSLSR